MSDFDWGYSDHPKCVRDVTDHEEWKRQEQWAIEDALIYARLEQIPGLPVLAPSPDFMEFFEGMLDANLHVPLDLCTPDESEQTERVRETEQATLVVGDD